MWRKWIGAGLLVLAVSGGGGCRVSRPESGHKLGWRTLSRGLISGLATPTRVVIRDEATWYRLWADHASEMSRVALPPSISFPNEMAIAVALGSRPSGGYLVDIVDVELQGRTVRVLVGERKPAPGTMQIQQVTQPYIFIALPAMNARVEFRDVSEREIPRAGGAGGSDATANTVDTPARRPSAPVDSPRGAAGRGR